VSFSPDGKRIVSGSFDKTVKVWDAQTGQETFILRGHLRYVTSVSFSPNGKWIVSGSIDKTLKVWNAQTGRHPVSVQETLTLKGHSGAVTSVSFSPDGKRIVSGVLTFDFSAGAGFVRPEDRKKITGEIKVWDISSLDTSP